MDIMDILLGILALIITILIFGAVLDGGSSKRSSSSPAAKTSTAGGAGAAAKKAAKPAAETTKTVTVKYCPQCKITYPLDKVYCESCGMLLQEQVRQAGH